MPIAKTPSVQDEDEKDSALPERSAIAKEIRRLTEATCKVLNERSRVPQPTFWYLFHNQIQQLKQQKKAQRTIDSVLGQGLDVTSQAPVSEE